ncbi:MAG: hypothetical protein QXL25_06955 [Candidatus Bathyarchaeia archaeon]
MPSPKVFKKHKNLPEQQFLPFNQLSLEKQLNILKAYVTYYINERKSAGYKEIAPLVGVSPTMVSGSLKFWVSLGLLIRSDRKYIPSEKLIRFCNKLSWGTQDEAWAVLRDALRDAWFVKRAEMLFTIRSTSSEDELLNSLGSAASILKTPDMKPSLKYLLELLEKAQFIKREEDGAYSWAIPRKPVQEIVEVADDKFELVTFLVGTEKYVVPLQDVKKFVLQTGRKVAPKEHKL